MTSTSTSCLLSQQADLDAHSQSHPSGCREQISTFWLLRASLCLTSSTSSKASVPFQNKQISINFAVSATAFAEHILSLWLLGASIPVCLTSTICLLSQQADLAPHSQFWLLRANLILLLLLRARLCLTSTSSTAAVPFHNKQISMDSLSALLLSFTALLQ